MLSTEQKSDELTDARALPATFEFGELVASAWTLRWLGFGLVALAIVVSVVYLNMTSYKYTAKLTVTAADQQMGGNVSGNLASLGSLVGVDIGGGAGSAFTLYAEAVKSTAVADTLSNNAPVMRTAFSDSWDPVRRVWRQPASPASSIIEWASHALGLPVTNWRKPGAQELKELIEENVVVNDDRKNSAVHLTYEHVDRAFAVQFVEAIHKETDRFLRERFFVRSSAYVNYLERRLATVKVAEYRQSIADTLASYERTRMMASVDAGFAAEKFGSTWVSTRPTSPRPLIVLLLALTFAVLVWLLAAIVRISKMRRTKAIANTSALDQLSLP